MLTLNVIDTIDADAVEVHDYVEFDNIVGYVTAVADQGDHIAVSIRQDSDGEIEDYPLLANDPVNLLVLR